MRRTLRYDPARDAVDRRGALKCMAWIGTGAVLMMQGGVLRSAVLGPKRDGAAGNATDGASAALTFVQLSDSHIGFAKAPNLDVPGTLREAVARINALPERPAFILHTGDVSQLSKPAEFDTAQQILREARTGGIHFVPGEHDVLGDDGRAFRERFGAGTLGHGWRSFDHGGVHFVGLVNVVDLRAGGLGQLGAEQLAWLAADLAPLGPSTPVVVFAHIPLWSVYPAWGWGTDDAAQALALLKRFGSVTVLNGHIHQVMQKVEGHVTFHTAMSTAFPQPAPGAAPGPGPMKVDSARLRSVLGFASLRYVQGSAAIPVIDAPLDREAALSPGKAAEVHIDNFTFTPPSFAIAAGATVSWVNHDDSPHTVTSTTRAFASKPLDTGDSFSFTFARPGEFPYFCSIHPHMTGTVTVR